MNVAVLVKAVIDLSGARYSRSERKIQEKGERLLAPVSENVLEAARELKEKGSGIATLGILLGRPAEAAALKKAMAFGLDDAVMIAGPVDTYDHAVRARLIKAAIDKIGGVDALIAGDASTDGGGGQVGIRVAEALGFASLKDVNEATGKNAFALLVAPGANEPKIPNVMAVMKAAKKDIKTFLAEELLDEVRRRPVVTVAREEWVG